MNSAAPHYPASKHDENTPRRGTFGVHRFHRFGAEAVAAIDVAKQLIRTTRTGYTYHAR